MVLITNKEFDENETYSSYFDEFSFELSDFQKWSIKAIVTGNHSLITAHTGSGKTLPAEFAIQYFKKLGKKVIYTGPIKALCNQKLYDFRNKFPNISFGILTGDIKDNPEADVLIMTTEILRNTLFNKQIINNENMSDNNNIKLHFEMDFENELGAVIFDEVHYINDIDRGSVWEQSILLLPSHVQLIMLSATIHKPEDFANWIENEKKKQNTNIEKSVYLSSTNFRVVPLTHYMWLSMNNIYVKRSKDTPLEYLIQNNTNKPILIGTSKGVYNEENYYKIHKILNYLTKNKAYIKRSYVLNDIVNHLNKNDMLPAICFVFSRKHVEMCANEIEISLYDDDDKTPNIIEHECKQILISKLPNYKEYLDLPELQQTISLLKKGIAIHHAGILPIIREMVEMLFEKNYIKLLFATETFAIGINMPTKTVIFTSLNKYTNGKMRQLYSHEYTQMAGRAGRRGIDTVGHVIHCNNLFDNPSSTEYQNILTGPPQILSSKFKISSDIILNILSSIKDSSIDYDSIDYSKLKSFIENTLLQIDIFKEIKSYDNEIIDIDNMIEEKYKSLHNCKTSFEIITEYHDNKNKVKNISSNKARKKISNYIKEIEYNNTNIIDDYKNYDDYETLKTKKDNVIYYKNNANNYIETCIKNIINVLKIENFINNDKIFKITNKGIISRHIQEVHSLVFAELYEISNGYKEFSPSTIAGVFSCFTNISLSDDIKLFKSKSGISLVDDLVNQLDDLYCKYEQYDVDYNIQSGYLYEYNFDIINYIIDWCNASNEIECKEIILNLKKDKSIFIGDFVKAILKINNLVKEFENICEIIGNIELLHKIKQIPVMTLKFIASNQSLYI